MERQDKRRRTRDEEGDAEMEDVLIEDIAPASPDDQLVLALTADPIDGPALVEAVKSGANLKMEIEGQIPLHYWITRKLPEIPGWTRGEASNNLSVAQYLAGPSMSQRVNLPLHNGESALFRLIKAGNEFVAHLSPRVFPLNGDRSDYLKERAAEYRHAYGIGDYIILNYPTPVSERVLGQLYGSGLLPSFLPIQGLGDIRERLQDNYLTLQLDFVNQFLRKAVESLERGEDKYVKFCADEPGFQAKLTDEELKYVLLRQMTTFGLLSVLTCAPIPFKNWQSYIYAHVFGVKSMIKNDFATLIPRVIAGEPIPIAGHYEIVRYRFHFEPNRFQAQLDDLTFLLKQAATACHENEHVRALVAKSFA